jgi:predicted HTH transcriptional regulator
MKESDNLEFKSSVWQGYDGETGEIGNTEFHSKTTEDMVLKTICAFLNSDGGTLIIGVRDRPEKSVIGIEEDFKFCKEDDVEFFLNKLSELFANRFDSETIVGTRVFLSIASIDQRMVCRVDVTADSSGWSVKTSKKQFEFYVRQGPKSTQLEGRDVFTWLREK